MTNDGPKDDRPELSDAQAFDQALGWCWAWLGGHPGRTPDELSWAALLPYSGYASEKDLADFNERHGITLDLLRERIIGSGR